MARLSRAAILSSRKKPTFSVASRTVPRRFISSRTASIRGSSRSTSTMPERRPAGASATTSSGIATLAGLHTCDIEVTPAAGTSIGRAGRTCVWDQTGMPWRRASAAIRARRGPSIEA
ncbi:hypothetical protein [Candidatus Palauibacter sp.]|uniref:hypothetical protein n=1 Tax=Candidatus Palauibacter sp. TaxID=3101350 RepID=UPI003CC56857